MSDAVEEFRAALRVAPRVLGHGRADEVKGELNELVAALALAFEGVTPFVAAIASRVAINRYRECNLFPSACPACSADAALNLLLVTAAMLGEPGTVRILERVGELIGCEAGTVTEAARELGLVVERLS